MLKAITLLICAAFVLRATCHAAELTENTGARPHASHPNTGF